VKRQPRLVIELRLEERGRVFLDAATYEDERRLRMWLASGRALDDLNRALARLFADIDARDQDAA
jgi:hypothetical protein